MPGSTATIIPAYNAERFLAAALDSVLGQVRAVDRIIVVDDASTDGTLALAHGYASRGHPVDVLTWTRNAGPGSARNRGIAHADADVLLFLDADDRWLPQHAALLLDALARRDGAGFAHCHATGAVADPTLDIGSADRRERVHDVVWPLLYHSDVPQSAVAARLATVLAVGAYGEGRRHAEDYDLWLRLALVAPYVEVCAETFVRGCHGAQATNDAPSVFRGAWEARHRLRAFADARGTPLEEERWGEVLRWAYERDLDWAWQSRSREALTTMLAMHRMVPGSDAIQRGWLWRARYLWPGWRAAAWFWDALPDGTRRALRRSGGSTEQALHAVRRRAMLDQAGHGAGEQMTLAPPGRQRTLSR